MNTYVDAGTTYTKIISDSELSDLKALYNKNNYNYYISDSHTFKLLHLKPTSSCGHMIGVVNQENEIIALARGAKKYVDLNSTVLDLGSRDAKWISFKDGKFHDMDWNTSCASSTGATVEMLLKFYDVNVKDLEFTPEKYNITCGIFGLEKIMDSVSKGEMPSVAISKFIHGIAYNAWKFAKKPDKLYLSGGFCENKCLVDSLKQYCDIVLLGRFILCEGLINE